MSRTAVLALVLAACGRSQGIPDQDLNGLVFEVKKSEAPIELERAAKDPAELHRALMRPYRALVAAIGTHTVAVSSTLTVTADGKVDQDLSDHAMIELGDSGAYHATYTNSADYGRETIYVPNKTGGTLYLRPRYQRWHERTPETPEEPVQLRDAYFEPVAATWELLAPGAELTDRGPAQVAGRAGRKIEIKLAPEAQKPTGEQVDQRRWREARTIDAVAGEVVLDADKGVPLAVKLSGAVGFQKDGKRYTLKVSVDAAVSGIGTVASIAAPPTDEVVATPERMREVDDRDFLLQGIAPALRKNPDGTAVAPAPAPQPAPAPAKKETK